MRKKDREKDDKTGKETPALGTAAAKRAQQLQEIVDGLNSSVSAVTIEDGIVRFVFANDKYYSLLGYTRAQFEAEVPNAFLLLHPDDRDGIREIVERLYTSKKSDSYTFRCFKRNGKLIHLRCDASITHIAGVAEPVLLSLITDVTNLAWAEQTAVQTTKQLQAIINNINGGVTATIIENKVARFLFVNDQYYAQLGYTRAQYEAEITDAFSLVHPEDQERVKEITQRASDDREPFSITYRIIRRDGSVRWMKSNISITSYPGFREPIQLAVANDITAEKEAQDRLRMSEEQFRIAAALGERRIARYDIQTQTYYHDDEALLALGFPSAVENVPQAFVDAGYVAPESVPAYLDFYNKIKRGEKDCSVDCACRVAEGGYRWMRNEARVIFDAEGQPSQAIHVSFDITEQREREAIYKRWQQSMREKQPESYTLFRWNLSKETSLHPPQGSLIHADFNAGDAPFNARTLDYATRHVFREDRAEYLSLLHSDSLLANYYRGKRAQTLEYREILPEDKTRWLRLSVELMEAPNSTDVEIYLMYEDIDDSKQAELLAVERANTDPLTGILNRASFAREISELFRANPAAQHALLMLDIDGFKLLNDTFGHLAGDQALIDIANALRSILRHGDLLCRLGGDEFLICLKDVPYDAFIEKKAHQICALTRRSLSPEVHISASVGVAIYPRHGTNFDDLYRHADAALYHIKGVGKDNFAFYQDDMKSEPQGPVSPAGLLPPLPAAGKGTKRRMLIVDDNAINRTMLINLFQEDFLIETAIDGQTAMMRLRHFGAAISVVLLDLIMPGMDGFAVLDEMRNSLELQTIPVIVVSGQDERETSLRAIRSGASDYVTKPVDPDLIRLRVYSVVSKVENERLRAQNSYLLLQGSEEAKYRTVLVSTGTVVVEYDWINGVFSYDPSISQHIAGTYDGRKLWRILLADMVADAMDVKDMQDLIYSIANDRKRTAGSLVVLLKTPAKERQWFRMQAFKRTDEFELTDKMILTFNNINEEVLAEEKLRFQAERDKLTGLYNRRTFLQKVEEMVFTQPANTYIIAVGDVDGFSMINDRFGHAEGDKLLKHIAEVLQADVRAANGLCGRLGNDGFAALIPNAPSAIEKTNRYPWDLLSDYPLDTEITCSIGYYTIDDPAMSADGMLDRAALAKQTVKGKYGFKVAWYHEAMREKLLLEQKITDTMEAALRNGEFDIYLQPQYNHINGQICGAEALVRWLRPEGPMFLPGEFVPIFEKNGFITQLDEYVWDRTAALLHRWLKDGLAAVPLSVNVSRLDTHDRMLCEKLLGIVNKYDIPIDLFRLEITESLFEEDDERLIAVIDTLHKAGFLIEMDDFGSGYSSLNILQDVQVDFLKLDMRFFSGNKARSSMILNAIMRMARWLNIPAIAEGVELREQADYLASIGCPTIQGYLYAKPMPVAAFETLLAQNADLAKTAGAQSPPIPDTQDFWALNPLDSRLFYTYMDAAVIFEYHAGSFEAVRANKRFLALLDFAPEAPLPTGELLGMHPEDIPHFLTATQHAITENGDVTVEVRRIFQNQPERTIRLRCTLRPMPRDGDKAVILCMVEAIT